MRDLSPGPTPGLIFLERSPLVATIDVPFNPYLTPELVYDAVNTGFFQ